MKLDVTYQSQKQAIAMEVWMGTAMHFDSSCLSLSYFVFVPLVRKVYIPHTGFLIDVLTRVCDVGCVLVAMVTSLPLRKCFSSIATLMTPSLQY